MERIKLVAKPQEADEIAEVGSRCPRRAIVVLILVGQAG